MVLSFIPKWLLKLISANISTQREINILLSNAIIILLFLVFRSKIIEIANQIPHFCLFEKLTSLPCPLCGGTRALCEISKGNLITAIRFNGSIPSITSFFIMQIPLRIISLLNVDAQPVVNIISKVGNFFILLVIIIFWFLKIISLV